MTSDEVLIKLVEGPIGQNMNSKDDQIENTHASFCCITLRFVGGRGGGACCP